MVRPLVHVGAVVMLIHLEPYEYERAREIGVERHYSGKARGYQHQDYALAWQRSNSAEMMDPPELANVNGALTEIAVAKYLGIYWHGHGGALDRNKRYRIDSDLGGPNPIEVRHVLNRDHGPLLRDHDVRADQPTRELWAGHVMGANVLILGGVNILAAWDLSEVCPGCRRYEDQAGERRRICQSHLSIPNSQGRNPQ